MRTYSNPANTGRATKKQALVAGALGFFYVTLCCFAGWIASALNV